MSVPCKCDFSRCDEKNDYFCCKCVKYVHSLKSDFNEVILNVDADENQNYTEPVKIKNSRNITVFIKNYGTGSVICSLQDSPDSMEYVDDSQPTEVGKGELIYLTPSIFSKYLRLSYKSFSGHNPIKIWFQIQDLNYSDCLIY